MAPRESCCGDGRQASAKLGETHHTKNQHEPPTNARVKRRAAFSRVRLDELLAWRPAENRSQSGRDLCPCCGLVRAGKPLLRKAFCSCSGELEQGCEIFPLNSKARNQLWPKLTPELSRSALRPRRCDNLPNNSAAAKRSRLERIVRRDQISRQGTSAICRWRCIRCRTFEGSGCARQQVQGRPSRSYPGEQRRKHAGFHRLVEYRLPAICH